ncbi:MAG: tRNA dihydrouridine synthase DusB [Candidatus Cloacimonetes bacterium]|nr:tRNA dihydrouridine synthase DusB [Candidatus Cloacimonadota bacterium]
MVKNNRIENKVKELTSDKLWLAPLAGYTDSVFRQICKEHGADVVVSEMISANALNYRNEKTLNLAKFSDAERPVGLQIFGAEPKVLAQGIEILLRFEPDFIDINMGCPMKKIVKTGAGSALLKDSLRLKQVIKAARKITENKLPLFVKIRSGWCDSEDIEKIVKIIESAGADAIAIHPRTRKQKFSGKSNWGIIKQIKEYVSIPVIGNGDIVAPEDAKQMKDETGCDSVMVGRGAVGKPWLFRQTKQYLSSGEYAKLEPKRRIDLLQYHFTKLKVFYGEEHALRLIRKFISGYSKGLRGARKLRGNLNQCDSAKEFNKMIANYLPNL